MDTISGPGLATGTGSWDGLFFVGTLLFPSEQYTSGVVLNKSGLGIAL